MRVDHRGPNIVMTQELLHGSDVIPVFQQMGGERVAVATTNFIRIRRGFLHMSSEMDSILSLDPTQLTPLKSPLSKGGKPMHGRKAWDVDREVRQDAASTVAV